MESNRKNKKSKSVSESSKIVWTVELLVMFCDLCIKEVEAENRPGSHFNKNGWENLITNFQKATGKDFDRSKLKNKWDSLKGDWKIWKQLIGKETGLGWNAKLRTIDASEEWWVDKLKMIPDARKFRKQGIDPEMEEKFDKMFMNTTATGAYAWTASSGALPSECSETKSYNVENCGDSDDPPTDTTSLKDVDPSEMQASSENKRKRAAISGRKVGGAAKLSRQIDRLIELATSKDPPGCSIPKVMQVVESLPGVEVRSDLWFFATRLFLSKEKREMFSVMKDSETKLEWLKYEERQS